MTRVVVVGGGVAGVTAALAASGLSAETTLLEASKRVGVSRALMPLLISDGWKEADLLLPEAGELAKAGVDVRTGEAATAVSREVGRIAVRAREGGRYLCDSAVICTGARSEPPALRGASKANVFVLKEPSDYLRASGSLDAMRRVVVSGPVPLSLKLGEVFVRRGARVRVYCGKGGLERQFSPAVAGAIRREAAAANPGGELLLVDGSVDSILGVEKAEAVVSEGVVSVCDSVVLIPRSVPSFPAVDCEKGEHGGLLVDSSMSTTVPAVFAAGDSTEVRFKAGSISARLQSTSRVGGEVAGINAAGGRASASPSWAVEQTYFGLEYCSAGLTQAEAAAMGLEAETETSESRDPRAPRETLVSMVYDRATHQIYGLEVAGWRASRLSSEVSLIVSVGLTAEQLAHAESPYSPGSSPEVSPIALTAGKVGSREES